MNTAALRITCLLLMFVPWMTVPQIQAVPPRTSEQWNPVADSAAVVVAGKARFTFLTDSMARLEWSPDGRFEDRPSQVVVHRRLPVPKFTRTDGGRLRGPVSPTDDAPDDPSVVILRTDRLEIRYKPDDEPFNKNNLLVRCRVGAGGAEEWWESSPPFEQCTNLGGTVRTLDGVSGACPLPDGLLNRYGWTFIDDSRSLVFDGTERPWPTPRRDSSALDWYVLAYGNDYKKALSQFTAIAGRIPLPPRFAFGAWWSRYWAYSDDELRRLVEEFRAHEVPLDVLVIDMDWHLDGWTGYTWNPAYFPDPAGFLKWAHEQGLKVTLNLHPADGVGKHEKAFPDVCRAMGLDPASTDRVPFDCTDPRYVDAYFEHLHRPLERMGVDFWWIDWQQGTETKIPGLDPLWWLNCLHWNDMERRADATGRRPLIFSRWGGLGNHRYQVGFSGDTFCDWPSLAFQPYFTSTAGNVGFAYWSHDIGGHQPGPVEPELFARWVQWGALSPILRTHTTKNPRAERRLWEFPSEVYEATKRAYRLRYELLPYIYTMARRCYDTGLPLCRPLYYEWPDLEDSYAWKNEYLFGDDLLVAPVTKPAERMTQCAMVDVWIPPGRWHHWFTGRTYMGPAEYPMVVPLDEIPLFVRDGAIIPTGPTVQRSDEKPLDPMVLNVFGAADGSTRVYEDDGRSARYERGECAWTPVTQRLAGDRRHVTVGPMEGSFPGLPAARQYVVRVWDIAPGVRNVTVNGDSIGGKSGFDPNEAHAYWWYNPAIMGPEIRIPPTKTTDRIEIVLDEAERTPIAIERINGFRGMMRILCRINDRTDGAYLNGKQDCTTCDWAFSLPEKWGFAGVEYWWNEWEKLVERERTAARPAETQTRNLLRLLGIYFDADVAIEEPSRERVVTTLKVVPTMPLPFLGGLSARIILFPTEGWSIEGSRQWSLESLQADVPLRGESRLRPQGPVSTGLVRGAVSIRGGELGLGIPIQKVFLPSINRWWVVGPFEGGDAEKSLSRPFAPETTVDLDAAYEGKGGREIRWRFVERDLAATNDLTSEFFVDFDDVFGERVYNAVAYALTYLRVAEETSAVLRIGSDDGVAAWLNGREVHRHNVGRAYSSKQDSVPVTLRAGVNTLLVKISQGGGDWGFGVHVETIDGRVLPQVQVLKEPSE